MSASSIKMGAHGGHLYAVVGFDQNLNWDQANAFRNHIEPSQTDWHLATLTDGAENAFGFALADPRSFVADYYGPWIGLFQPPGTSEPDGGWTWVTGEPLAYTSWYPGEPNNEGDRDEDHAHFFPNGGWNDKANFASYVNSALYELDFDRAVSIHGYGLADVLVGGHGDDFLDGAGGNDRLIGRAGDDELIGGAGNDYLHAGGGSNRLFGGTGDDVLDARNATAQDKEWTGDGSADWVMQKRLTSDEMHGGEGNDSLHGGYGSDQLHGDAGNDYLAGLDGNDQLDGGWGHDLLSGGNGSDTLSAGGGNDTLDGGTGWDTLLGGSGDDLIRGGDGGDWVEGGGGNDVILLGAGNDFVATLDDFGRGDDLIMGEDGDDHIHGGRQNDTLDGGAGADVLNGGPGTDILTGGAGADAFEFRKAYGIDTITDFSVGDGDKLRISHDIDHRTFSLVEDGAFIDFGDGNGIRLVGVDSDALANIQHFAILEL